MHVSACLLCISSQAVRLLTLCHCIAPLVTNLHNDCKRIWRYTIFHDELKATKLQGIAGMFPCSVFDVQFA